MTTTSSSDTDRRPSRHLHAAPLVAIAVIVGTSLVYGDRVPDELTVHWDVDGRPDGVLPHQILIMIDGFLTLLVGYGLLAMAHRVRERATARGAAAAALGLSAGLAGLHWTTLASNLGTPTGTAALSGSGLLLTAIGVVLAALLGWRLGPDGNPSGPHELTVEPLALEPGEAAIWSGGQVAPRVFWVLPILMAVIGVLIWALSGEGLAAAIVIVSAVLVLSMLRVRVSIGPAGVRVSFGPLGLIHRTIPLRDVRDVSAEQVDPLRYGGWGLRAIPGSRAIVLACGPGLRVQRRDAADVVITLDDAQVAAGVLRAHLDAAKP